MKPKMIVWISAGNFTKEEANSIIDAGIVPMYHIGQNEPKMIEKFMAYKKPINHPIIWSTQLFNKADTIDFVTSPGTLSGMIDAIVLTYMVPGLQCLDIEPPDGSKLVVYRKMPMLPKDYLALYHAIRPYLKTFDYVMPSDPSPQRLYNVLRGLGVREITQTTYPKTCTMEVVDSKYLLREISGDIFGVEVSADGLGHGGKAQRFADAVARFPDERTLFVYPTGGNFGQIAKDIIEWMGK